MEKNSRLGFFRQNSFSIVFCDFWVKKVEGPNFFLVPLTKFAWGGPLSGGPF